MKSLFDESSQLPSGNDFLYWEALKKNSSLSGYQPLSEKYVVFKQYPGGLNNIRMSLELAAVFAFLLNRTLVLPPRSHFYLLEGECGLEDFFDVPDLGIRTVSFTTYCQRQAIDTDTPVDDVWRDIEDNSVLVEWNMIEGIAVAPGSHFYGPYAERYCGEKQRYYFLPEMLAARCLYFPGNLLGNYYRCVFAGDRLTELSRYVARHIHYRKDLFLEAWKLIDQMGDGDYAAIHVRRNDFQYPNLFIDGEEILANIKPILNTGALLYIATDAADTGFLKPLEDHYQVCYFKDLSQPLGHTIDANRIGCVEQLICSRARVFIGNGLSTWSSYIYRLRGFMEDVFNVNYYENTSLCALAGEDSDQRLSPSWSGQSVASWAREFPEVWDFKNNQIFVSVASYRDPDVVNTISDLLQTADRVEDIVVGVCLQGDEQTIETFPFRQHPNVRLVAMDYREAKGVCFARAKIQTDLYQDERYFLQVDSHSRFSMGWDSYLKTMLNSCKVNRPILSTYPNAFDRNDRSRAYLKNNKSRGIVYKEFDDLGYLDVIGERAIEDSHPVSGMWIGAGFVFTYGRWIKEIPYETEIYFKGEEDSLHIRSYCHGWDVFVPPRNVVFHDYNDNRIESDTKVRPLHWEDHPGVETGLEILYRLQKGMGVGSARSVADFEAYFGVDFKTREIGYWARQGIPPGSFIYGEPPGTIRV